MKKVFLYFTIIFNVIILSASGQSKIAELKEKVRINVRDISIEKIKIKENETKMKSIYYEAEIVNLKSSNILQDINKAREFVFLRTPEEKAEQILNLKEKLSTEEKKLVILAGQYDKIEKENKQRLSHIQSMENLNSVYAKKLVELENSWQAKYFDW